MGGAELKLAVRSLVRARGTALTLVVTLALGVAANTTVFSFVKALLLSPLPFAEPERLVRVESMRGGVAGKLSALEVQDLNERARLFEGFAAYRPTQWNIAEGGPPIAAPGTIATHNLFGLLGGRPVLGETWPRSHDRSRIFAVVMSHGLWQRRYGSDPGIVGRSVLLDGAPYTVLGVMEPGFGFPSRSDLWRRSPDPDYDTRAIRASSVLARLKPGTSLAQARDEVAGIAARLAEEFPETNRGTAFRVTPLREAWIGHAGPYLLLLAGAVLFVLVVACANAAALLVARALEREREIAVRLALGAGRGHLLRQALGEGVVLAVPVAALGAGAAFLGVRLFEGLLSADLPPWMSIELDLTVLAFNLATALVVAVAASLLPVRQALVADVQPVLRDASSRVAGTGSGRLLRSLVALQLALALLLLSGAGLLARSALRLEDRDLGFDGEGVLTLKMDPPWSRFSKVEQTALFYRRILDELRALPGVSAAAANDALPLTDAQAEEGQAQMTVLLDGQSPSDAERNPYVAAQIVSHGYFDAMRIPLRRGRGFEDADRIGTVPVALVGEAAAERLWPGQDPLGRRVRLGRRNANYRPLPGGDPPDPWLTVVGVVGSVRRDATGPPAFDVYLSDQQLFAPETYLVVRGRGNPLALAEAARDAIARVDHEQAVFDVRTLDQRLADRIWQQRLSGRALAALAALALALAAVGLYALVARAVGRRRRELAVRASLGASHADILRLVLADMLPLLGAGTALGLTGALLLRGLIRGLVHDPAPSDELVLPAVAALLCLVALVAALIPARRAARADPAQALRPE